MSAWLLAQAAPADLPERVFLKSDRESFTHEWYVALRGGRIFIRPTRGGDWRLLPPDGVPRHHLRRKTLPRVQRISADGDNLIAVDEDGLVYYMKFSTFDWIDQWGLPPVARPLYVREPFLALAVSHRGPLAARYEDIDGNAHPIDFGVSTLYALSPDGRFILYADPWLTAHFNRRICLPRQGRFHAAGMSASASTLMVVDASGGVFTRLADYDTLGENPVLRYTYRRRGGIPDRVRLLPAEDWREQPRVPGRISSRVTIFQTGAGNAGRMLRAEGVGPAGEGGFYEKPLTGAGWRFVRTGVAPQAPLLSASSEAPASRARSLAGRIEKPALNHTVDVALVDFDPDCPPGLLRLAAQGASVDIPLHLRRYNRDAAGDVESAAGTLLMPPVPAPLAQVVSELFGDAGEIEVDVEIAGSEVIVSGDAPGWFRRLRLRFAPR